MVDPVAMSSFPTLLQRFFSEHLGQHRAVSPRTIAAYRDTFRLLLQFAEETIGKSPTTISLADLNMKLILGSWIIWRRSGTTVCAAATPGWRLCGPS
jgi:integrase/recombinase XerD